tara:strand:- start:28 stop:279 length:252 start_codon:yes stop_codon:yes gene_type:complete
MYNYKFDAIYELYPTVKHIEIRVDGTIIAQDENFDDVAVDNSAVDQKATELENAKVELKASAKAKLIAGEALTEEEADVMIGG